LKKSYTLNKNKRQKREKEKKEKNEKIVEKRNLIGTLLKPLELSLPAPLEQEHPQRKAFWRKS